MKALDYAILDWTWWIELGHFVQVWLRQNHFDYMTT